MSQILWSKIVLVALKNAPNLKPKQLPNPFRLICYDEQTGLMWWLPTGLRPFFLRSPLKQMARKKVNQKSLDLEIKAIQHDAITTSAVIRTSPKAIKTATRSAMVIKTTGRIDASKHKGVIQLLRKPLKTVGMFSTLVLISDWRKKSKKKGNTTGRETTTAMPLRHRKSPGERRKEHK